MVTAFHIARLFISNRNQLWQWLYEELIALPVSIMGWAQLRCYVSGAMKGITLPK